MSVNSFALGAVAPWQGMACIVQSRRMMALSLAPAIIAILAFVTGIAFGIANLDDVVAWFMLEVLASPVGVHDWIYYAAVALAWPAFILALAFAAFASQRILGGPFSALLAMRALSEQGFRVSSGPWSFALSLIRVRRFARLLASAVAYDAALLLAGAGLFVASFIPVINAFAVAGYFLLLSSDCISYSLDAKGLGWRERWSFAGQHFAAYVGFALSLAIVIIIPGIDFFAYPIAVAGGAWLIARLDGPASISSPRRPFEGI